MQTREFNKNKLYTNWKLIFVEWCGYHLVVNLWINFLFFFFVRLEWNRLKAILSLCSIRRLGRRFFGLDLLAFKEFRQQKDEQEDVECACRENGWAVLGLSAVNYVSLVAKTIIIIMMMEKPARLKIAKKWKWIFKTQTIMWFNDLMFNMA